MRRSLEHGRADRPGCDTVIINAELRNASIDSERIFRIFLGNMALIENTGYIRKTSEAAVLDYAAIRQGELYSPELGRIPLAGHLSLRHIDANHRYGHVQWDVETWSPYLAAGGRLLLDDYVWVFGDELLGSPLFDPAFVSGDTQFLRRTDTK